MSNMLLNIEFLDSFGNGTVKTFRTPQSYTKIDPLIGPVYLFAIQCYSVGYNSTFSEIQVSRFLCIETDVPFFTVLLANR